jgi:hypothetical protein
VLALATTRHCSAIVAAVTRYTLGELGLAPCVQVMRSVLDNRIQYARGFGYRVCFFTQALSFVYDQNRERASRLLQLMNTTSRWLFWMDADAIFNRFDLSLTDFIAAGERTVYSGDELESTTAYQHAVHLIATRDDSLRNGSAPTSTPAKVKAEPQFSAVLSLQSAVSDGLLFVDTSAFSAHVMRTLLTLSAAETSHGAIMKFRALEPVAFKEHMRILPSLSFVEGHGNDVLPPVSEHCGIDRRNALPTVLRTRTWSGRAHT